MSKPTVEYNYEVFFEVFGKKMKTTVLAKDEDDAKQKVFDKINVHTIQKKKGDAFNQCIDMLDSFHDVISGKKGK